MGRSHVAVGPDATLTNFNRITGASVTTLDGCRSVVVSGVDPGHLAYLGWSPDEATIAYRVLPA